MNNQDANLTSVMARMKKLENQFQEHLNENTIYNEKIVKNNLKMKVILNNWSSLKKEFLKLP